MTAATRPAEDWSAVASAWDDNTDYVDRHSAAATDALIAAVDVRPGDRLLELAAGPGSLGARWSQLTGPNGCVVISDIAPAMAEVARRRSAGRANVEVAVLDASSIDRADASFDVVVCRMGLMFTPDPSVALAEIRRVLDAGGRFGALTWAGIEHNPWMTCVGMAAAMHGLVAGGRPPSRVASSPSATRISCARSCGTRDSSTPWSRRYRRRSTRRASRFTSTA